MGWRVEAHVAAPAANGFAGRSWRAVRSGAGMPLVAVAYRVRQGRTRLGNRGQTRSAAIRTYWKEPSPYDLMNASSMPVTREDVARSSQ
ncbi:hypothetical protein GCM10010271_01220 [Streptomyces kurssanovii]|nr:hypothetical protein GCM10010271_01220 [Streptomyces kurssanovii]